METPKSIAYMMWYNDVMPYSVETSIKADIAGQVLSMVYLKKIREDASAAYACGAQGAATISDNYHNVQFFAYCPMKPEKKDIAIEIMNNELPNLAKDVDATMVDKVKKPMLKQADEQRLLDEGNQPILQIRHRQPYRLQETHRSTNAAIHRCFRS